MTTGFTMPFALRRIHPALIFSGILCVYGILAFCLWTDWPVPWPDESRFAEPAKVLSECGTLRSDFIIGMHEHVYWQPPGYSVFLALLLKVVPFDFALLRSVSIIIGGGILGLVYALTWVIVRRHHVALLAMGLLAVNPNFVTYIKLIRMDGLSMLFQMVGLLLLLRAGEGYRPRWLVGSGLAFSCGILVHPLGCVGFCVGAARLLLGRQALPAHRLRACVMLCLPVVLAFTAAMALLNPDLPALADQMRMQFSRKSRMPWEAAWNFVTRYRSIPLFVMLVGAAALIWTKARLWRRSLQHATLWGAVIASVLVVSLSFELSYQIFVLPWVSVCIALAVHEAVSGARPVRTGVIALGLGVVVLNLLAYTTYFYYHFHIRTPLPLRTSEVLSQVQECLPERATALLYGYPDPFWYLRDARPDLKLVAGEVFNDADRSRLRTVITHIVITRFFDPHEDSLEAFTGIRVAMGLGKRDSIGTVIARKGLMQRFHPSVWVLERNVLTSQPKLDNVDGNRR